jgi:hypothetical protein
MRGKYTAQRAGTSWLLGAVLLFGTVARYVGTPAARADDVTRWELKRQAASYRRMGMFREAAETLERYASPSLTEHVGSDEMADALADAARLWMALDEGERASRDVERLEQRIREDAKKHSQYWIAYDDPRPDPRDALAAELRLELGALYGQRKPLAFQATYWEQALRSPFVSRSVAHRIRVEAALAQVLWRQSCPIPLEDGLCVRWRPPLARAANAARCDGPWSQMAWPQAQTPDAVLRSAALQAARRAVNAYPYDLALRQRRSDTTRPPFGDSALVEAVGAAALLLADAGYEQMLAMVAPEPLRRGRASPGQFLAWFSRRQRAFDALRVQYTNLMDFSDAPASHTATARLFQSAAQLFLSWEFNPVRFPKPPPPPPKVEREIWNVVFRDSYCAGLEVDLAPSAVWARHQECLRRAERLGVGGGWLTSCERLASQLNRSEWPMPSEVYPSAVDIPIQLDRANIQRPRKAVP